MLPLILLSVSLQLRSVYGVAIATPAPTADTIVTRDDQARDIPTTSAPNFALAARAAPLPTFTYGPSAQYFPLIVKNPEPKGDGLQIYPTGVYDEVPEDGIDIAFGPELRKKIKDTMTQNCKNKSPEQCRNALLPVIYNQDMQRNVKRVLVSTVLLGYFLAAVVVQGLITFGEAIYLEANKQPPKVMKLEAPDLHQIKSYGAVSTFAIETNPTADPSTITLPPPATKTTNPNYITVETLKADSGQRKKGDIVYHIPKDMGTRITDFLSMMGIQKFVDECKSELHARADRNRPCLADRTRRTGQLFVNDGPEGLMQLAQPNPAPPPPGPGQALGVPVQNIPLQGGVVVGVYLFRYRREGPNVDGHPAPIDMAQIRRTAAIASIIYWVLQNFGKPLTEVWVPQGDLLKDEKEEDFFCPKDIICLAKDCGAQKPGISITDYDAVCKTGKHIMCKCKKVNYGHQHTVARNYMDEQYNWLQQLIKLSDLPDFKPECSGGQQKVNDAANKYKTALEAAIKEHPDLKSTWTWTDSKEGYTISFSWEKKGNKDCGFDAKSIFPAFEDNASCVGSDWISKNGDIHTDCGTAISYAYRTGGTP